MILELKNMLPVIKNLCSYEDIWDSLIINRRKPHTTRVFTQLNEYRICLHRFEAASKSDCFAHPHGWPSAVLILDGAYWQEIGISKDLHSEPEWIYEENLQDGSSYSISNNRVWHKVVPYRTTYTIMINGKPFEEQHDEVRTTKGKDLEKLDKNAKLAFLSKFETLITKFQRNGK